MVWEKKWDVLTKYIPFFTRYIQHNQVFKMNIKTKLKLNIRAHVFLKRRCNLFSFIFLQSIFIFDKLLKLFYLHFNTANRAFLRLFLFGGVESILAFLIGVDDFFLWRQASKDRFFGRRSINGNPPPGDNELFFSING